MMFASSGMPRRVKAETWPVDARAIACVTADSSLPVAALMSMLRERRSCACLASPVAVTSFWSPLRMRSSAVPVASMVSRANCSMPFVCAERPRLSIAFDSATTDFSSSMAAAAESLRKSTVLDMRLVTAKAPPRAAPAPSIDLVKAPENCADCLPNIERSCCAFLTPVPSQSP